MVAATHRIFPEAQITSTTLPGGYFCEVSDRALTDDELPG